ncbi:MAG: zinc-ribbon and FHA domain-containing protein [Acidobacteria bacterium]|nr:zinc-ribbon and FHA domain-containing protein [Acidobacteriota bacterium]
MAEIFCGQCGHGNPSSANFCSSCGAPLEVRGEDHTISLSPVEDSTGDVDEINVTLDDLPAGIGMLVVKRGPGSGSRFLLDEPVTTAGRHPDSHIFLDDVTVSRRHAEVVRADDAYRVRDVGSLNGTYVNRERIDHEIVLANGDEVQIGRFKLVFLRST